MPQKTLLKENHAVHAVSICSAEIQGSRDKDHQLLKKGEELKMFTGLAETKGKIKSILKSTEKYDIRIESEIIAPHLEQGDSVAVDGVCQTVADAGEKVFLVQAVEETLKKTTFSSLQPGMEVNLEKALTLSSPLGGHLVQGHVNGTGVVEEIKGDSDSRYIKISAPREILKYCIKEGSVCVDGISLTIADTDDYSFLLNIIPETWERTTFKNKKIKDRVNIETDIIGRYVVSFLEKTSGHSTGEKSGIKISDLNKWGY